MFRVTVFPSLASAHLSQAFAGLYDLRTAAIVDLRMSIALAPWAGAPIYNVLVLEATDAHGNDRRIVFDVRDGAHLDAALLAQSDLYFKRTCEDAAIAGLPESLRGKVRPYGLNYACGSDAQLRNLAYARQLYGTHRASHARRSRRLSLPLRWLGVQRRAASANDPMSYARFETDADCFADSAVLFMTRLWSPNSSPGSHASSLSQLNRTRIELVRTLRERLGSRFIGGVHPDEYSQAECPDCVTDLGANKSSYLQLMRSQLVAVTSAGLHRSIGWKLGEYVAASRCIVSEPMTAMLPGAFVAGRHYLQYRTPAECADACERILNDPAFAAAMRRNNADYYQHHLKPDVLVLNHLQAATAGEQLGETRGVHRLS